MLFIINNACIYIYIYIYIYISTTLFCSVLYYPCANRRGVYPSVPIASTRYLTLIVCFLGEVPLYVARFMYVDGHMIPGKANYHHGKAYAGYHNKEFLNKEWYVLVEHRAWYVRRGIFKRSDFSELVGVKTHLKRTPVLKNSHYQNN